MSPITKLMKERGMSWLEAKEYWETHPPSSLGPAAGSPIPCGIAVNVDIETGEGSLCPESPTHLAALLPGKWLHVCKKHAGRLQYVGVYVKPLENNQSVTREGAPHE